MTRLPPRNPSSVIAKKASLQSAKPTRPDHNPASDSSPASLLDSQKSLPAVKPLGTPLPQSETPPASLPTLSFATVASSRHSQPHHQSSGQSGLRTRHISNSHHSSQRQASSTAALPSSSQRAAQGGMPPAGKSAPPVRASPSLSQSSNIGSPTGGGANSANASHGSGPSSMAKITNIQVLVLLSSMKEVYDATKAEQIQKLVDSHGMDVFTKYFRQLLVTNASKIFQNPPAGKKFPTHFFLIAEMAKLEMYMEQAVKVAVSLDGTEPELSTEFNLNKFLDEFGTSVYAGLSLAFAIKTHCKKEDIRAEADSIVQSSLTEFPKFIASSGRATSPLVFQVIESLGEHTKEDWPNQWRSKIETAIITRCQNLVCPIPTDYRNALIAAELLWSSELSRALRNRGPKALATVDQAQSFVSQLEQELTPEEIVSSVLYILFANTEKPYNLDNYIQALKICSALSSSDWQAVIMGFDREGLTVSKSQFLQLFNALLPLARQDENIDIQKLWGGTWSNRSTQLSFVVAFLSCTTDEIDVNEIPRLTKSFSVEDFAHSSDEVKEYAALAASHPLVSLEATSTLFSMVFSNQDAYNQAQLLGIPETVINANTDIFLVSAAGTPKPWTALQDQALRQLYWPFLRRALANYDFVMAGLWKQDNQWLMDRMFDAYTQNAMYVGFILDHAENHSWIDFFLGLHNKLSLDLATLAHSQGRLDIKKWFVEVQAAIPDMFPKVLAGFTVARANAVLQAQRERQTLPVDFSISTLYEIISFLENLLNEDELSELLRTCISAYPRIVNYGEGSDAIIDANCKNSPQIPDAIDAKMQEHYKRMYSGEGEVREIIENLQRYKSSTDPADQDLFACMIHGLFDEYNCFGEYPEEALATTAVLFGGVISFNLLSRIALLAALSMVYDSVKGNTIQDPMHKFGIQAMIQFVGRLGEWPYFCERILRLPELKGTEIYSRCEAALREVSNSDGTIPAIGSGSDEMGHQESLAPPFTCLFVDPPSEALGFEPPDDSVSEKVLFVLNNVSEQNLTEKLKVLKSVLVQKYYQWFATYLVEERAKPQPNFQKLYLQVLTALDSRTLWDEVLRETYISIISMLNSDVTQNSIKDRNYLKNLGSWLGSLTIARDKPIKFRNISFKELLTEGYNTNRLATVIPFTCKVLSQVVNSTVFRPPNPWVMEIMMLLMEIYRFTDPNLKLKFEIEVLCKNLDLDCDLIEPSTYIRNQKIPEDLFGADAFHGGDLSLAGLNRSRSRSERFSPSMINAGIPALISRLIYPPSSSRLVSDARTRQIFQTSVQQALGEIISPVVERSVTIAAIAAHQLVAKDYATEPNEEYLREAAINTVKPLSGSLALVTCKEPLRLSITNHIRNMARELPESALPEGVILMFVNENLDAVCNLVEEAAEAQSVAEIEQQIEESVQARLIHRATRPDDPFMHPPISRWGLYLPDPYKYAANGLTREQMEVYHDFGRSIRGILSQASAPRDPNRPPTEILDQFSTLDIISNPNDSAQQQGLARPLGFSPNEQPNVAFNDTATIQRASELLGKLIVAVKEAQHDAIKDLGPGDAVRVLYTQLIHLIEVSGVHRDFLACNIAHRITTILYSDSVTRLESELYIQFLIDLRKLSFDAGRLVTSWLSSVDDDRVLQSDVTFYLIKLGLMPIERIDLLIAGAVRKKKPAGLTMLAHVLEETILMENSAALRSSLALSFDALAQWIYEEPDNSHCKAILERLEVPPLEVSDLDEKQRLGLPEIILEEWVNLLRANLPDRFVAAFISQLHESRIFQDQDQGISFIRSCVEFVFTSFVEEASFGNIEAAYIYVDGLVKLIVSLVVYQPDASKSSQSEDSDEVGRIQLLDGVMSLLCMILSRHHNFRSGDWNQRVWFRLFSTMLTELQTFGTDIPDFDKQSAVVIGRTLLFLKPSRFPGFAFGWLNLLIHRHFMPVMLDPESSNQEERESLYVQLVVELFNYVGRLNNADDTPVANAQFYQGTLRLMLIVQHDFPDFVINNHFELLNATSTSSRQLRNLIVSAIPESIPKEITVPPAPVDQKFWDAPEMQTIPEVSSLVETLINANFSTSLERIFLGRVVSVNQLLKQNSQDLDLVVTALNREVECSSDGEPVSLTTDLALIHAVVISAAVSASKKPLSKEMPELFFFEHVLRLLRPEVRYFMINFMVDQLRFPNMHTRFYSIVFSRIFLQVSSTDEEVQFTLQQITRVFIERLSVFGPHPWGVLYTIQDVLTTAKSAFFELSFVRDNSEVSSIFRNFTGSTQSSPAPAITA